MKMVFFHFVKIDSRKFVFFFQEKLLEIKEITNFSCKLSPIFSKEYEKSIVAAKGYKNKVVLVFDQHIELLNLSEANIFSDVSNIKIHNFEFNGDLPNEIFFLNSAKHVLLAFSLSLLLLSENLEIINIHKFDDQEYSILIPNKESKSYIVFTKKEIHVFKIDNVHESVIFSDVNIDYIFATQFNHSPEIVYSRVDGSLFINNSRLDIRVHKKLLVFKEFLVYFDYFANNTIKIFNLKTQTEVYEFVPNLSLGSFSSNINIKAEKKMNFLASNNEILFINCSAYKLFYIIGIKVFMHSFISKTTFCIDHPFEFIVNAEFIDPLLFLSGQTDKFFGIFILDYDEKVSLEDYKKLIIAPVDEEEIIFRQRVERDKKIKVDYEEEKKKKRDEEEKFIKKISGAEVLAGKKSEKKQKNRNFHQHSHKHGIS